MSQWHLFVQTFPHIAELAITFEFEDLTESKEDGLNSLENLEHLMLYTNYKVGNWFLKNNGKSISILECYGAFLGSCITIDHLDAILNHCPSISGLSICANSVHSWETLGYPKFFQHDLFHQLQYFECKSEMILEKSKSETFNSLLLIFSNHRQGDQSYSICSMGVSECAEILCHPCFQHIAELRQFDDLAYINEPWSLLKGCDTVVYIDLISKDLHKYYSSIANKIKSGSRDKAFKFLLIKMARGLFMMQVVNNVGFIVAQPQSADLLYNTNNV